MKTKDKKADKTKASSNKKDKKSTTTETTDVMVASALVVEENVVVTHPTEILPNESVSPTPVVSARRTITNAERQRLISHAAYYRAQRTGFGKTNPVEDWLLAEREVDAMIAGGESI